MSKTKKHFGLFKRIPIGSSPTRLPGAQNSISYWADAIQGYFTWVGGHDWNVEAHGYVLEGDNMSANTSYPHYMARAIRNFIERTDMQGFVPSKYQAIGGIFKGACGHANIGGNWSSVYSDNGNCGIKTSMHEYGHCLGLAHASTKRLDNGSTTEYGDDTCIMGSGQSRIGHLCAPYYYKLGLATNKNVTELSENDELILAPLETDQKALHDHETQIVVIKLPDLQEWNDPVYFLSIRKGKGVPYPIDTATTDELAIVYLHELHRGQSYRLTPDITTRSPISLPNGLTVELLEYENERARVKVSIKGASNPTPTTKINHSLPAGLDNNISENVNGLWANTDQPLQGFSVIADQDKLHLSWYTYNQRDKRTRHYSADSVVRAGNIDPFEIYTTTGGSVDNTNLSKSVLVGTGTIVFADDNNATLVYDTNEWGRNALELTRVARQSDTTGISGVYKYNIDDSADTGIVLHSFEDYNSAVMYIKMPVHKAARSPITILRPPENSSQRWVMCHGIRNDTARPSYDMDVYLGSGKFAGYHDTDLEIVGTAKVTVLDKTTARVWINYKIDGIAYKGKKFFYREIE